MSTIQANNSKITVYVVSCWIFAAFGGLMFGYDIGISGGVSGMDDFLIKFFPNVYERKLHAKENNYCKYDDQLLQLFTSSLYLSALVSSFFASKACSALGRRPTIFMASLFFIAGAVISAASEHRWMLIVGRILFGVGVGFGNETVPLFLTEVAPIQLRGAVNIMFQLFVTIGIFIANLVNYATSNMHPNGWRVSLGLAAVPALMLLVGCFVITDTPASLIERGKDEQGKAALKKVRGVDDVEVEFKEIVAACEQAKAVKHPFRNLMKSASVPPLVIAVFLQIFQQFTGINAIMFYAPVLFQTMGFKSDGALLSAVITGLVNVGAGIPDHHKLRFQAVMALGRYTEWTAQHPDTLQLQLDYIMAAFDHSAKDVIRAAALSFKFFCNDCASLLVNFVGPLQQFYAKNLNKLPISSQEEITEGVASVVAKVPNEQLLATLKLYLDPVMAHLIEIARQAKDEADQKLIADKINLLTIFFEMVRPEIAPGQEHPAVKYCQEIFPTLANMISHFNTSIPILERVCRCWRYMVLSYRTAMRPLLPDLATKLIEGFDKSRQGCFLWATASIVREFSQGVDDVDPSLANDVYQFYEQQAKTFLRILSDLPPEELPDLIEDYFRLAADMALYFPTESIMSPLMDTVLLAACSSLTLLKEDPIIAVLHFLRDLLGYGRNSSPSSSFDNTRHEVPEQLRNRVKQLVVGAGVQLVQRIMTGMMYSFPEGCFADSSGVLLDLFELMPEQVAQWVASTVGMLPQGSITPQESERFLNNIRQRIQTGDVRMIRTILQDFTTSYRRRNVAPREGLGRLEASRFRFSG